MTLVGASPVEGLVRDYWERSIGGVRIGKGGNPIRSAVCRGAVVWARV